MAPVVDIIKKQKALQLHAEGKSVRQIAEDVHATISTVASWLRQEGLKINKVRPIVRDSILKLYNDGLTTLEIAKEINCTVQNVRHHLQRENIVLKKSYRNSLFKIHKPALNELSAKGLTVNEISTAIGLHTATVRKWLWKLNIPSNKAKGRHSNNKVVDKKKEKIVGLVANNKSVFEIAKDIGVAPTQAKRLLRKYGLYNPTVRAVSGYWIEDVFKQHLRNYLNEDDHINRSNIFKEYLHERLVIMSETVWNTYFSGNHNFDKEELISDAINQCIHGFTKFDFERKSFAYFQTVIKNYYHEIVWSNGEAKRRLNHKYVYVDGMEKQTFDKFDEDIYNKQPSTDSITIEETFEYLQQLEVLPLYMPIHNDVIRFITTNSGSTYSIYTLCKYLLVKHRFQDINSYFNEVLKTNQFYFLNKAAMVEQTFEEEINNKWWLEEIDTTNYTAEYERNKEDEAEEKLWRERNL